MRIEATSYIQWNKAPIDPSHSSETYWLHVSAASGRGTTSGGFTIDMHPRLLGTISAIRVKSVLPGKVTLARPSPLGTPPMATVIGSCSYGGKAYAVQIDVVGNLWRPSPVAGGRGASVKGSVRLQMIDAATKAISSAVGARQSSVTIWQQ